MENSIDLMNEKMSQNTEKLLNSFIGSQSTSRGQRGVKNDDKVEQKVDSVAMILDEDLENERRSQVFESQLDEQFADIQNDMNAGKQIDIQKYMTFTLMALFHSDSKRNIQKIRDKVDELDQKVIKNEDDLKDVSKVLNDHEQEMDSLKKKIISLEVESYSTKFVLKNVNVILENSEAKEKNATTEATVNEILSLVGMNENQIANTFRMYPKTKNRPRQIQKKSSVPPIYVEFISKKTVSRFLGSLKDLRSNEKFANLQCDQFCCPSLLDDWSKANEKAFYLRKNKKMATQTKIINDQVMLLGRMHPKEKFVALDYKQNDVN